MANTDRFSALGEARAMWADLQTADSARDLNELWLAWVEVNSPDAHCAHIDIDAMRADLADHIREFCYATGTHCADVFGVDHA